MKRQKKVWSKIGEITTQWIKECYPTSNAQSIWKYKDRLNSWFEFLKMTDAEFIEDFKRSVDKYQWARDTGTKIVAFYNSMIQGGYSVNTGRNYASSARAFSRDMCTPLMVRRGKIAKAESSSGEHEFSRIELAKMFYVGDVRGKAVLATAVALGFSIEDFSELKRDFIESLVTKSLTEKIDFVGFSYKRGKTNVESRSHTTPEMANSLKSWFEYIDAKRAEKGLPKSEWVWCNGNHGHLNAQTLNDIIKDLVKKANVAVTGSIRFHLLRKYVMSTVHTAGFSSWETKRVCGKEIPTSDDTYLQQLNQDIDKKFPQAYEELRLTGFANHNHTNIEQLQTKIQQLEVNMENMAIENQTLRRVIEYAIPKDKVQTVIHQLAKEYGIAFATYKGKTPTLQEVITELIDVQKLQAQEDKEEQT